MQKAIGRVLIVLAMIEVIVLRIVGIDMTEGQLLVNFWPAWLSVVGLAGYGAWLVAGGPRA